MSATTACLEAGPECAGPVELREALSGTGVPFPRCDRHWDRRLDFQAELDRRYPSTPPADWSPLDAGESWYEDY